MGVFLWRHKVFLAATSIELTALCMLTLTNFLVMSGLYAATGLLLTVLLDFDGWSNWWARSSWRPAHGSTWGWPASSSC